MDCFYFYLTCSAFCNIQSEAKKNHTLKPRVVLPDSYVKGKRIDPEITLTKSHSIRLNCVDRTAEVRPPSKKGMPVVVKFSLFIKDINSINVEDMDFR